MLADLLLDWFDRHARVMPWRGSRDPYAIWVSEVMLQQTQVATVIPYFERFMARFPTVASLAEAEADVVLKHWEGLGYYSRARNLQKAAQRVVDEHQGQIPGDWRSLRALPGVGDYTAGAIASIAFNLPHPAVDGNVFRVLSRVHALADDISLPATRRLFEDLALSLIPEGQAWRFNQALMELGATVCRARQPACETCALRAICAGQRLGHPERFPVKGRKTRVREAWFATVVARNAAGELWVVRRPDSGLLGGLWAFPFLEVDPREAAASALEHDLMARWGIRHKPRPLIQVPHVFTHRKAVFDAYLVEVTGQGPDVAPAGRWVSRDELDRLALPLAHQKIRARVEAEPLAIDVGQRSGL